MPNNGPIFPIAPAAASAIRASAAASPAQAIAASALESFGQVVGSPVSAGPVVSAAPPAGKASSSKNAGRRASTFYAKGGRRVVKAYPLTELEMITLGVIQGTSALFFAIFGASLGFFVSISQSIAFAGKDTPPGVISFWRGLQMTSAVLGILVLIVGLATFWFSGWNVRRIQMETEHSE